MVSPEASPLGLQRLPAPCLPVVDPLCLRRPAVCVHVSSSCKDTARIGLEPP